MFDSLGDRMKSYERVSDAQLTRRTPVMGRLDGKAFHSFTRDMKRPWDERLHECMWEAALHLCSVVQGCKVAYVQSDEITLLLNDWASFHTTPWMNYRLGKMCSIAAAECTAAFLRAYQDEFGIALVDMGTLPVFDARFWNVPMEEVANAFLWRQQDCTKNSVTMLANSHLTEAELVGISTEKRLDKLVLEKGLNWNNCPVPQKRGVCVVNETYDRKGATRRRWVVDKNIPVFSKDRDYIEKFLLPLPGSKV